MSDIIFDYADRVAIFDDPTIVFDGIGIVHSGRKLLGNDDLRLGRVLRGGDSPSR